MTRQSKNLNLLAYLLHSIEPRTLLSSLALDPTFGTAGKVQEQAESEFGMIRISASQQSTGNIVVATLTDVVAQLQRFDANGALDTSFGSGGTVDLSSIVDFNLTYDIALTVQSDDKIIVFAHDIARFDPNGSFDNSFDNDGIATIGTLGTYGSYGAPVLALYTNGTILAAQGDQIIRLTSTGSVDPTFGSAVDGNIVTVDSDNDPNAADEINSMTIQGNNILVSVDGASFFPVWQGSVRVTRLTSGGAVDNTFGTGGAAVIRSGDGLNFDSCLVTIQSSGKLLVSGREFDSQDTTLFIARVDANGAPDGTFGTGGSTSLPSGGSGGEDPLVLEPNGKILIGGQFRNEVESDLRIYRLTADGQLETSLDVDFEQFDTADSFMLQPGGRLVSAGYSYDDDWMPTLDLAGITITDSPASPSIVAAYAGSTNWSPGFFAYLGNPLGYQVAGPDALPWPTLNQFSLTFSQPVSLTQASFQLTGLNVPAYAIQSFTYNATTNTATLTLPAFLTADRLTLSVPSLNLSQQFNVLPGDANSDGLVDGADFDAWFTHLQQSTFNPAQGDLNADGLVDGADFDLWFTHLQSTLPQSLNLNVNPNLNLNSSVAFIQDSTLSSLSATDSDLDTRHPKSKTKAQKSKIPDLIKARHSHQF